MRSRVDCTCRSPTFSKMKAAPWKEFKIKKCIFVALCGNVEHLHFPLDGGGRLEERQLQDLAVAQPENCFFSVIFWFPNWSFVLL